MNKLFVAMIATQILNAAICIAFAQELPNSIGAKPDFDVPPEPTQPLPAKPSSPGEIQIDPIKWKQMRSEILQIRQQLGFNPLAGIDMGDDEASDAQFAKTLDGVAGATKPQHTDASQKPAPGLPMLPPTLPAQNTPPLIAGLPQLPPPSLPVKPSLSYRDTLLAAARKLDRKADFLEDTNQVPQSRKIRRLANRIRSEALGQE